MIIVGSVFNSSDNTGVKKILSIGIIKKSCINLNIGDFIIGSVKKRLRKRIIKIRKSFILKSFIVHSKKISHINFNNSVKFSNNSIIILDIDNKPKGKKVIGIMSNISKSIFYKSKVNLKNAKFIM